MTERVETVIVGAGFAGLAMAGALNRAGRHDYVVLERAASVGGTWRDNTYPGVACDVPSHLYGLAAHPNPSWSGVFARGDEIRSYLEGVAAAERLGDRLRLSTTMIGADWDAGLWRIDTSSGTILADILVLACGRLTEPSIPEIPGLDTFPGPLFHSSRWDHTAPLAGARVAVIGTGASAVQLVPELARTAAHVTVFQRTPAWIVPRSDEIYSEEDRARWAADPASLAGLRDDLFVEGEARFASRSGDADAASAAQAVARAHLDAQVSDPALRAALTPDYAFGCKRVLLSDAFYPALSNGAADGFVTLVPSALSRVDGTVLTASDGTSHDVDAVVLATGFATTQQPYAELVRGDDGNTLATHWAEGMTSFASTVVAGFPNLFILDGPNAALGHNSSVLMIEAQTDYVVGVLAQHPQVFRVDPAAESAYGDAIAEAAASTPWITGGCRNWYVDERSGRLTLLWPGTVAKFRDLLSHTDGSEFLPAPVLERGIS